MGVIQLKQRKIWDPAEIHDNPEISDEEIVSHRNRIFKEIKLKLIDVPD